MFSPAAWILQRDDTMAFWEAEFAVAIAQPPRLVYSFQCFLWHVVVLVLIKPFYTRWAAQSLVPFFPVYFQIFFAEQKGFTVQYNQAKYNKKLLYKLFFHQNSNPLLPSKKRKWNGLIFNFQWESFVCLWRWEQDGGGQAKASNFTKVPPCSLTRISHLLPG